MWIIMRSNFRSLHLAPITSMICALWEKGCWRKDKKEGDLRGEKQMKYQHLFTADAHCLRCSRCLRCLRCTGPDAWFHDKEPIKGVRVYDRMCAGGKKEMLWISFFVVTFLFLDFVVPGFCFFASLLFCLSVLFFSRFTGTVLHTDSVTRRSWYKQAFYTKAFTHKPLYTKTPLHTNILTHVYHQNSSVPWCYKWHAFSHFFMVFCVELTKRAQYHDATNHTHYLIFHGISHEIHQRSSVPGCQKWHALSHFFRVFPI